MQYEVIGSTAPNSVMNVRHKAQKDSCSYTLQKISWRFGLILSELPSQSHSLEWNDLWITTEYMKEISYPSSLRDRCTSFFPKQSL